VIGLLAALFQSCYFTAVSLTSVPLATLITIGTAPVIVLSADRLTGRPAGRLAVLTTGLAVTGLGLLVGLPSGFRETAVLASAGMAVLAAAGFAAITLISMRTVAGLDDLAVTGFGFTVGGLLLMPAAGLAGGIAFRPGLPAIGLLGILGTAGTAALVAASSVTSATTQRAVSPNSLAACSRRSCVRPQMVTVAPSATRRRAAPRPMPLPPPVTSAAYPSSAPTTTRTAPRRAPSA